MNTTAHIEKPTLKMQRVFRASRERVFAAWTNPEELKHWFGPEDCTFHSAAVDLRTGGEYHIAASNEGRHYTLRGQYREVNPPSKLVYTWRWEGDPDFDHHESLVTVEFIDLGGSTELRLTQESLPTEESLGKHEYGWTRSIERLAQFIG